MRFLKPRRIGYRQKKQRRRTSSVKYLKILVILCVVAVFSFAFFLLWQKFFGDESRESLTANIKVLKGKNVEYLFAGSSKWEAAFDDLKLQEGDGLKTQNKSWASLDILGTNFIYLDENTEIKIWQQEKNKEGHKYIKIEVLSGHVWIKTSEEILKDISNFSFEILLPQLSLNVFEKTVLDIEIQEEGNQIRVAKGAVEAIVLDSKKGKTEKIINVKVGQEVLLSAENIGLLDFGTAIHKILDPNFLASEWHLSKLAIFYPEEATEIKDKSNVKTIDEAQKEMGDAVIESPQILAPINNTVVPDGQTITIEGIAPSNAQQIEVNGFPLTRFNPGDKKWSYLASETHKTIHGGINEYKVVAITRDGKRSLPAILNLTYEGITPAVISNNSKKTLPQEVLSVPIQFDPPKVTHIGKEKVVLNQGEMYETSASRVTVKGIVPKETYFVEFNGYRLKKFKRGDLNFYYTAISEQNMKVGENYYRIVAIGPNNIQSETALKIHYTPLEVVGETNTETSPE